MPKHLIPAFTAGLLASGLFLVSFGKVFLFLPSLPLFFIGLSSRSRLTYVAVFTATLLIGLIAGSAPGVLFLLFMGLPAWYFSKKSLLSGLGLGIAERIWYPIGLIIIDLTLYACVLLALMSWYYAYEPGGLQQLLSQDIQEAFSDTGGEYGDIIERMVSWSFAIFPMTIWMWGIMLYSHAWLANKALTKQKLQIRPDIAVYGFIIPSWMLSLLAIAALATLIGSPAMGFLGKMILLTLMLPYFFLGCTIMHRVAKIWLSSRFFIFFVYFLIFTQLWPVLILAGIGLWHQIKCLSGSGGWSRH